MRLIGNRRPFVLAVMAAIALVFMTMQPVSAQDAKALLNDVNKALRQAEKDMFGGKTDHAVASIPSIQEKLLKAKEADPGNPSLKSVEAKFQKLIKDLERRTGKNLGGGSATAAGASTSTALPDKPKVKPATPPQAAGPKAPVPPKASPKADEPQAAAPKPAKSEELPYHARRPAQEAQRELARIDGYIERLGQPDFNKEQLLRQMDGAVESARKNLEEARSKAAEKGVTAHPDFDEIDRGITEAVDKIARAKEGHAQASEAAEAAAGEVQADVKVLRDEYEQVEDLFSKASGGVMYYNELEPLQALLTEIEDFEKSRLEGLTSKLAAFGEKYGATEDEIDKKADAMGYEDPYYRASFAYVELAKGIENIRASRTATAEDLVRRASDMKERSTKGIHDFARFKQQARIREWGELAARFDSDNAMVKEFMGGLDAWIAEDTKTLQAKIDKATFPKQSADAPKDAAKLTKIIREFLQKEEDRLAAEGKESGRVAAVVITGPWKIFKTNILGEPVQYNLPITTAVEVEKEKSMNVMRVYHGTMLTEEYKGVKMAPPFIGATVGDSYYIRPSAVK